MNVYLAGKIGKNDWRHALVSGLAGALSVGDLPGNRPTEGEPLFRWPVLRKAVDGIHDYVGPFFIACDHGCFHGDRMHGTVVAPWVEDPRSHGDMMPGSGCSQCAGCSSRHGCSCEQESRRLVARLCFERIDAADVVFAWVDSPDAFGTIAEIGYAVAKQKAVFVASPQPFSDLWLTLQLLHTLPCPGHPYTEVCPWRVSYRAASPREALQTVLREHGWDALSSRCESPIEAKLWQLARTRIPELIPQMVCGPYRLDFAIPRLRLAIELDGHDWHKTREQRTNDAQRDRYLNSEGWTVLRFTGTEITANVGKCITEIEAAVRLRSVGQPTLH